MTITVYSTPSCVQCVATTRALEALGLKYQQVDLSQDRDAYAQVTQLGYRQAPVIIAGEVHWSGFRPDLIKQLG